jgi:hypothetical protein
MSLHFADLFLAAPLFEFLPALFLDSAMGQSIPGPG